MKMGNILSLWRYDVGAYRALLIKKLRAYAI
jgi:hypothetical protein